MKRSLDWTTPSFSVAKIPIFYYVERARLTSHKTS